MRSNLPAQPKAKRGGTALAVSLFTLAVYGGAILLLGAHLRNKIREHIVSQDSEVLLAANTIQQLAAENERGGLSDDPRDQLASILETSRLRGVLAVRLFDREGKFLSAFPPRVLPAGLSGDDLEALRKLSPRSHFHPQARLAEIFPESKSAGGTPLLEAVIPLRKSGEGDFFGAAQFIMDGEKVAAEFATLDHYLKTEIALLLGLGGLVMGGSLGWAFRRLQKANLLLAERTSNLLRANHELTLAAKTSALGAVTAHLIHGLKNPLFGLQNFVSSRAGEPGGGDTDWQNAFSATRRMQGMINDVVRILREESGVVAYEVSIEELGQIISGKMTPLLKGSGLEFEVKVLAQGALANREANLTLLILHNLLQNAVQALKGQKNGRIQLVFSPRGEGVECQLSDNGTGLPAAVLESLFAPCQSSRPEGTGLGLAISRQLAHSLGAELRLEKSSPEGTVFSLFLPQAIMLQENLARLE